MSTPLPKKLLTPMKPCGSPAFWVERLCILPSLTTGTKPIRNITFKRGLNIIWSRPATEKSEATDKGAGHAAGKTSLCRALRYALGENEFGNDFMKAKLQNNHQLYQSYIAAEIWIGDQKWTVARPINKLKADHAYQNTTIDDLLTGVGTELSYKEDFIPTLEKATTGRLKITQLDQERPIVWKHILEALSRDQETHLASLHQWRNSAANTDPMRTSDADRCYLMRALLGLAEQDESTLLQQREKLAEKNRSAERNIASYRHIKALEMAKLGMENILTTDDLGPQELFVNSVRKDASHYISNERNKLNEDIEVLQLLKLRNDRDLLQDQYNRLCIRFSEIWEEVDDLKLQLQSHRKKPEEDSEPLDKCSYIKARVKHGGKTGICSVPYWLAKGNCNLYKQCSVSNENDANDVDLELNTVEGQLRWQISSCRQELKKQLDFLKPAKDRSNAAIRSLLAAEKKKVEVEKRIRNLPTQIATKERSARNLIDALNEIDKVRSDVKINSVTIQDLDEALDEVRGRSKKRQNIISGFFNQIIKYLINDDLTGELSFTKIENNASLKRNGELDSAAYRALRCIAYDYTALLSSYTDTHDNCHPRFLLHDSPRESDLERGIYQMIFHFLSELEKFAPDSFQTIITTTEDPPEEFQQMPYLRTELSSSSAKMRFYGKNL